MNQRIAFVVLGIAAVLGALMLYLHAKIKPAPQDVSHVFGSAGGVPFGINNIAPPGEPRGMWNAVYTEGGHTAHFRLVLEAPGTGSFPFGKGRIEAQPDSDDVTLLQALKLALQAKSQPGVGERMSSLPFTYAVLGTQQTRGADGGFDSNPPGTWMALKIFIKTKGSDDEAEMYLNLSPSTGDGEFAIKDPEFGDGLLQELAKVI